MRVLGVLLALLFALTVSAQPTGFTYQGRLEDGGVPANGAFDVRFTIYGAATGGTPLTAVVCADDVVVVNGVFTVLVPLTAPTAGSAYLEVEVRPGAVGACASGAGFTTLSPRQEMTPAPRAVYANAVPAQSPTLAGALRFNAAAGRFEGFNGTWWVPITSGAPLDPLNSISFLTPGGGTFTVPAGVTRLGVDLWGGGGAGGARGAGTTATGCASTFASGGGGGGASGTFMRAFLDVTPGETLQIFLGAGGATTTTAGQSGQHTTIARGGFLIARAYGGGGGQRGGTFPSVPTEGTFCATFNYPASGAGGVPGAPGQIFAAGTIVTNSPSAAGFAGYGPVCTQDAQQDFCTSGGGGPGVNAVTSSAPLPQAAAGAGGSGGHPFGSPTAGAPGMIRLFWD
jgi:hypothetical protein